MRLDVDRFVRNLPIVEFTGADYLLLLRLRDLALLTNDPDVLRALVFAFNGTDLDAVRP